MSRSTFLLSTLLVFISASVFAAPPTNAGQLFGYKSQSAPELKVISDKVQAGIRTLDVEFVSVSQARGKVKAFLISPANAAAKRIAADAYAGILYFHWLGKPNGDRQEFLEEATALARRGSVALLVEGYFPWQTPPKDGPTDNKRVVDETIDLRRSLDVLLAQPGVDPKRLAFVGHDYGAMYGSILAGVDHRIQSYVLLAPTGSFSRWSLDYWHSKAEPGFKTSYREALASVDPIKWIGQAAPAQLYFQFAKQDEHVREDEALAYAKAASQPQTLNWYEAKHDLLVPAALADRQAWLVKRLALK